MSFYDFDNVHPHSLGMAKEGERVIFTGKGGYDSERERAGDLWAVGTELVVESCSIGGWSSSYQFAGWPGSYNTVMFEPAIAMSAGTAKTEGLGSKGPPARAEGIAQKGAQ